MWEESELSSFLFPQWESCLYDTPNSNTCAWPTLFGNFPGCPLYSSQHAGSAQVFWLAFSRKGNKFAIIDNKQSISRLIKSAQDKHCKISFLLDVSKETNDFKIMPVCQWQIKKSSGGQRTQLITSWKSLFQNNNLHGPGCTVALGYKEMKFLRLVYSQIKKKSCI